MDRDQGDTHGSSGPGVMLDDARRSGTESISTRLPIGAEVIRGGGVRFRVWAPRRQRVEVVLQGTPGDASGDEQTVFELEDDGNGSFSGIVPSVGAGTLYYYQLDGDAFPDPASRFQPEGPHGPSQVV